MCKRWASKFLALTLFLSLLTVSVQPTLFIRAAAASNAPDEAYITDYPTDLNIGQQAQFWVKSGRSDATNANKIMYLFDWGDGTETLSSSSLPTGTMVGTHTWYTAGIYEVRVMAYDVGGTPADSWSDYAYVGVSGDDKTPTQFTPTAVAVSSKLSSSYDGKNVLDSNSGTYWSSATASSAFGSSQWISFDLGGIKSIDSVQITPSENGTGFPAAMSIQYSNDNSKWFSLPARVYSCYPNPGSTVQDVSTGGIAARYMRIYVTQLSKVGSAYACQIADVKFIGSNQTKIFTSKGGLFDADLSNMWTIYGTADNEVSGSGDNWGDTGGGSVGIGSTEWFGWIAQKLSFTDRTEDKNKLVSIMYSIPEDADGFVWATPNSKLHLEKEQHSTNNASYILGAYQYYMWTGDKDFLVSQLPSLSADTSGTTTLIQKLRLALNWYLNKYNGKNGLFINTMSGYDGTNGAEPSNYWDDWPYGYKDAYTNVMMYEAVGAMTKLEAALGNTAQEKADEKLLPLIKTTFNNTFWDSSKGRYIDTIDVNGVKHDNGLTELNFMAVASGIASKIQAQQIYQWLDGKRIISGDTSTGSDIYAFKYAARTNTIDAATTNWWNSVNFNCNPEPSQNCQYGTNVQNGGAILYTSFEDILGRLNDVSADNAISRLETILDDFQTDELRRTSAQYGTIYMESGLVPLVMLYGFMGVTPQTDGLRISPNLPSSLTYAGMKDIYYNGVQYTITASKSVSKATVTCVGTNSYEVTVPNGKESVIALKSTGTNGKNGSGTTTGKNSNPDTGDSNQIAIVTVFMGMCACAALYLGKKKRF